LKVEYIEDGLSRRHLDIEVPPETVEHAFEDQAAEVGRRIKIPGFRKGKIPKEIVKTRFRAEILEDVVQNLVPRVVGEALRERSLHPIEHPHIGRVEIALGQPLRFRASFEVMPAIEARDYKKLRVKEKSIEVDETEVEKRLEALRERAARFDPVTDRGARDHDYVVGTLHEKPAAGPGPTHKQEGLVIEVRGELDYPGLHEKLQGVKPGDTVSFEASFPEGHGDARRAGKTLAAKLDVLEVKEKSVPALDDDLAKDLGDFGSLAELRSEIRKTIESEARHESRRDVRQQLVEQVVEANRFDPPEALVEGELDRRIEDLARTLISRGVDPETAGVDWRAFREGQRKPAVESVQASMLLDRIAEQEAVHESQEEVTREIDRLASEIKRSPDVVRAQLLKEEGLERLQRRLRRDKAIDFLLENARIERG